MLRTASGDTIFAKQNPPETTISGGFFLPLPIWNADFKNHYMKTEWKSNKTKPRKGGEYNVVWNLDDNDYPVSTSMDWDAIEKKWTDPRCNGKVVEDKKILFWAHLPKPPSRIPKSLWFEEDLEVSVKKRNEIYGQCMHGSNMSTCEVCSSYQ